MSLAPHARLQVLQAMGLPPLRRRPQPLPKLRIRGAHIDDLQGPEWKLLLQALGIALQRCAVEAADGPTIELCFADLQVRLLADDLRSLRGHPARKREWWPQLRALRRALQDAGSR